MNNLDKKAKGRCHYPRPMVEVLDEQNAKLTAQLAAAKEALVQAEQHKMDWRNEAKYFQAQLAAAKELLRRWQNQNLRRWQRQELLDDTDAFLNPNEKETK